MSAMHQSPFEHPPEWSAWGPIKTTRDDIRYRERRCKVPHCRTVDTQVLGKKPK